MGHGSDYSLSSSSVDERRHRKHKKKHRRCDERKEKRKEEKKRHKRRRLDDEVDDRSSHNSTNNSGAGSSSESDSSEEEHRRRRRHRKRRRKEIKRERRERKRHRTHPSAPDSKDDTAYELEKRTDSHRAEPTAAAASPVTTAVAAVTEPSTQPVQNKDRKAPMTREEYEVLRNTVHEVYDEQSRRYRLVRGTGEIIERIVSRQDHQSINRQATYGDGRSFARQVFRNVKK